MHLRGQWESAATTFLVLAKRNCRSERPARSRRDCDVRDHMKTVRSLIRFAMARDLLTRDPCAAYELPSEDRTEVEVYSPDELALMFTDPLMGNIWRFLAHTCLRVGELCWLTPDDVIV